MWDLPAQPTAQGKMSKQESKFNGPPMNIRPRTPKSAVMMKDRCVIVVQLFSRRERRALRCALSPHRRTSRDAWANEKTQGYIRERGMLYGEQVIR